MTHEPGRERAMTYACEKCGHTQRGDLIHNETVDEYWCESCIDNANEGAYDRQQERDLESPPESAREAQIRTWEEKQKLHKR
jgi:ssDNA-binding Zn-finger/Zn-ribbon topoisomerase 1